MPDIRRLTLENELQRSDKMAPPLGCSEAKARTCVRRLHTNQRGQVALAVPREWYWHFAEFGQPTDRQPLFVRWLGAGACRGQTIANHNWERHLRKPLLAVVFTATLASLAEAQQVPDPRVADLVQAGKIRLALFLPGYTKSAIGELRGVGTGAVAVEIARALAARLRVQVLLVENPTPPQVMELPDPDIWDLQLLRK
jgi:hypothetical protein